MSNIVVPQLGESVVEARIARWLKKAGDRVEVGEPVVELETEKIDLEVSAEKSGVIASIARQEGEDVKIGELLAVVDESGAAAPAPAEAPAAPPTTSDGDGAGATAAKNAPHLRHDAWRRRRRRPRHRTRLRHAGRVDEAGRRTAIDPVNSRTDKQHSRTDSPSRIAPDLSTRGTRPHDASAVRRSRDDWSRHSTRPRC